MTIAKDMTGASLQEIFDFVSQHLLTQNKASKNINCFYRHPEGKLMCAAGVCIPDDKYNYQMEGRSISSVNAEFYLKYNIEQCNLLANMQYMHDFYEPEEWKTELAKMAKTYNLHFAGLKMAEKRH